MDEFDPHFNSFKSDGTGSATEDWTSASLSGRRAWDYGKIDLRSPSRRSTSSSVETLSFSPPIQSPSLYPHFDDGQILDRRTTIEELDSELKTPGLQTQALLEPEARIASAPIKGRGVPFINSNLKPPISRDPSEVTDLGNQQYSENTRDDDEISISSEESFASPEDTLQKRLLSGYHALQEGKKGFFPRRHVRRVFHEQAVREVLSEKLNLTRGKIDDYIRRMNLPASRSPEYGSEKEPRRRSYVNIFAILILTEKTASISDFLDQEIGDDALPLTKEIREKSGRLELRPRRGSKHRIRLFDKWSFPQRINFYDWQWTVNAPYFYKEDERVCRFRLQAQVILPFINPDLNEGYPEAEEHEGGFSSVSKAYIHADHYDFGSSKSKPSAFAIKKLKTRDDKVYRAEFRILAEIRKTKNPHLVSLLAGYSQSNTYYLMFDWAECDLRDYWWKRHRNPRFDIRTVQWVAQQCAGLAGGLEELHRFGSIQRQRIKQCDYTGTNTKLYGRHGDIKPQNILLYEDPSNLSSLGTLKIADFGSAEFNTAQSRSKKSNQQIATSLAYRPPECDFYGMTISRSYDIWTMGCLYLEFIAWLLGGWDLLRYFAVLRAGPMDSLGFFQQKENPFFDIIDEESSAVLKPGVEKFIEEAHHNAKCSQFIHDFLDLVQRDLLVIETNDKSTARRIGCGRLHSLLHDMYERCEKDPEYCTRPKPV